MINVSGAFKQALFNDNRKYVEQVTITLADNTVLSLTNANLWNGGFEIDDAVSNDNAFTALGSAIINTSTIVINNMYDDYSDYDFTNAKVVMSVGLELYDTDTPRIEMCKKGTYIVDEATYNGSLITIKTMDYMSKFDEPYSKSSLVYPATADEIIRNACTLCGVTLDTLNFPNKNFVIDVKPNEESVTFREVISYVATICGCYARCNPDGHLELKWYDQDYYEEVLIDGLDGGQFDSSTPYSTGDSANGGTFNPWNTGDAVDGGSFTDLDGAHYISSIYSPNIAVDDVVITGVAATYEVEVDGKKTTESYMSGSLGYLITIDKNPMITEDNVESIVDRLGTQLTGLKFRKATVSHSSDPTIEAGDLAVIVDRKGSAYPILVTRTHFKVGGAQTTVCGAETPARKSASRFSEATKNAVQLRKELEEQKTAYDRALEELAEEIANAEGMYETQVQTQGGGVITYMHNKPDLEDSDVQIMISNVGVTVTANGTDPNPTWYGLTVDGTLIASIMNTIGINFDWGVGGALTIQDTNSNETFYANAETGVVRIKATSFSLTDGSTIESIARKSTGGYGTCTTAAGTAAKEVTLPDFGLYTGARISVKFSYGNTVANPTLNVNNTGAKTIRAYNANLTATSPYNWQGNSVVGFVYDGTYWQLASNFNQQETFNRLTNGLANQGIYLENGILYINASRIHSGTLTLGGANNVNGLLVMYNASNSEIGRWDKDGLTVSSGTISGTTISASRWIRQITSTMDGVMELQNKTRSSGGSKYYAAWAIFPSVSGTDKTDDGISLEITNNYYNYIESSKGLIVAGATYTTNSTSSQAIVYLGQNLIDYSTTGSDRHNGNQYMRFGESLSGSAYAPSYIDIMIDDDNNRLDRGHSYIDIISNEVHIASEYGWQYTWGTSGEVYLHGKVYVVNSGTGTATYDLKATSAGLIIEAYDGSSKRVKHDITEKLNPELNPELLYQIPVKQFVYDDGILLDGDERIGKTLIGFIAEDVDKIYPVAADHDENDLPRNWNYRYLLPPMLKLIQQQHEEIERLKQVINLT